MRALIFGLRAGPVRRTDFAVGLTHGASSVLDADRGLRSGAGGSLGDGVVAR
jgi:hypothetical protein